MSRLADDNHADYDDEHFECADAGAAGTFPTCAGDLKKGDCVVIRARPCRITSIDVVKTGKHGHTKAVIDAEDLFTGRRYEMVAPGSYPLPCPFVSKVEYMLIDIDHEGALSLLSEDNEQKGDLDLPEKDNEPLARAIRAHFNNGKSLTLTVQKAMGIEQVISFKYDSHGR